MVIFINAAQIFAPGIINNFQPFITEVSLVFFHRHPISDGNYPTGNLQIRHIIQPRLACFKHGQYSFFTRRSQIHPFNLKYADIRSVAATQGRTVRQQAVKRQKVSHAGLARLRQYPSSYFGNQGDRYSGGSDNAKGRNKGIRALKPGHKKRIKVKIKVQICALSLCINSAVQH